MAARAAQRRSRRSESSTDARVSQLVARHERSLMRVAQHWSLCRDDASDAYQRVLEIYLRRLDSLDPTTEIAWLKVVVKHEALAVRRQRAESLPLEEVDLDTCARESERPVDDLLAGRERVRRSAEALRRLKPDEAQALMLKAQGMSYAEIAESLRWTYTKVNRCITEGRARFLKVYAEIEAGEECERFAPTLAALVGGTAGADALLELRPHISNCATCRATVRKLHATRLGRLGALWPLPALVAPLRWLAARLGDRAEPAAGPELGAGGADVRLSSEPTAGPELGTGGAGMLPGREPDRDLPPTEGITDLYEVISPLEMHRAVPQARPRVVEWALQRGGEGVAGLKQHAVGVYARAADPTPLAGVRPGAAAAAVAGCLAIGGSTTYCVTQGVDPIGGLANVVSPAREQKRAEPREKRQERKRVSSVPASTPQPTPVATPTVEPPRPSPEPAAQATPRPTPEPTPPPTPEEEYEPLAPATAASTSAESSPASPRTPAAAPASGPGEFDGP